MQNQRRRGIQEGIGGIGSVSGPDPGAGAAQASRADSSAEQSSMYDEYGRMWLDSPVRAGEKKLLPELR
ncbi:hypothetical protein O9K51_00597 [Purpureocillium lavendulum]|uniref:Uncharacterized protein n=1 Tax=Purpureocillium lavendulum TaxID=1247861 RepID=A0AB34G3X1_9HYPO|nr:hypothetical protein O9K51_00597 [Purpureocillium lavendulum]